MELGEELLYYYKAKVERVVDGDTVEFSVDVGFNMHFKEKMRIAHYAAPETKGEESPLGLLAKQKLEELLPKDSFVLMRSHKIEKYGRWLAEVILDPDTKGTLADYLISLGFGVKYDDKPGENNPRFDPRAPYPLILPYKDKA